VPQRSEPLVVVVSSGRRTTPYCRVIINVIFPGKTIRWIKNWQGWVQICLAVLTTLAGRHQ